MITKELIDRINYLARKQRSQGLDSQEREEQKRLRDIYIQNIKQQVVDQLGSAGIHPKNACEGEHDHGGGGKCGCKHCN